jgi:DNA (cytosine-5)-methyltransferase 1
VSRAVFDIDRILDRAKRVTELKPGGDDSIARVTWPLTPPCSDRVAVELCCGMGGIGIGLAAAGYEVTAAYDAWPEAVAVYNHNSPKPVAQVCDLLSAEGKRMIRKDRLEVGEVDLLAAGPPCKGFSQIRNGHHHRPNSHNQVLLAMPEYVALLRPRLVLIENVPDLARHRDGDTLRELLRHLERPGPHGLRYRVESCVYDAAVYGTPQARRRLLILCVRHGAGNERLPPRSPDLSPLYAALRHGGSVPDDLRWYHDVLANPEDLGMTTAAQALSDLPELLPGEAEVPRPYATGALTAYQRAMRAGAPERLSNTRTPNVREETVHRLEMIPPGGCARVIPQEKLNGLSRRYDSAYRRLHPGAPSTALSTKYDCVYHFSQHRSLSVREYARLQAIPDRIEFPESLACRRYAYEMIGNSVPPFLVHGVLAQLAASAEMRGGR